MPATRRIPMVYKNKGLVKNGCCVVPSCVPPTAGNVTINNCRPSGVPTYDTRCDYTVQYSNGTSFQWFYILQSNPPQPFVDGANVSGSQTPTMSVNSRTIGCPPIVQPLPIFCVVTNSCGSATSGSVPLNGC